MNDVRYEYEAKCVRNSRKIKKKLKKKKLEKQKYKCVYRCSVRGTDVQYSTVQYYINRYLLMPIDELSR